MARELYASAQTAPKVSLNAQPSAMQNSPSIASWDEYRKWIENKQTYVTFDQPQFVFDSPNPTQPQNSISKLGPRVSFNSSNVTLAQSLSNPQRGTHQKTTASLAQTTNSNVTSAQAASISTNALAQTLWPSIFQPRAPLAQTQPQLNANSRNQRAQPAHAQQQLNAHAINQQQVPPVLTQPNINANVLNQQPALTKPKIVAEKMEIFKLAGVVKTKNCVVPSEYDDVDEIKESIYSTESCYKLQNVISSLLFCQGSNSARSIQSASSSQKSNSNDSNSEIKAKAYHIMIILNEINIHYMNYFFNCLFYLIKFKLKLETND